MKYPAEKKQTPRGEDKEEENNLDFLYLSVCYVYPLHWAVNFNWTATYCSWVHTGSIKKSCRYFFFPYRP